MSDTPRTRRTTRPAQPHSGQSLDPVVVRKGGGPGIGALVLLFGGLVFFCYVFNMGGLQVFLDSFFSGVDMKTRAHNGEVTAWVATALPYAGFAILGVIVLVILTVIGRGAASIVKPAKAKPKPKPAVEVKAKAADSPRPAQEFIRPARLAIREEDLKPRRVQAANDSIKKD